MASKRAKGAAFLRFVPPIVETLRELGSSGTASEVADKVLERLGVSPEEQEETTSNGHSRVRNQIGWARFYLAKAGYLDTSERGIWTLTESGRKAKLGPDAAVAMMKEVRKQFPRKVTDPASAKGVGAEEDAEDEEEDEDEADSKEVRSYKARVLDILRALPPSGFERICQRLLRESGFQQVVVTGKSGDGGIDGHGVLEINPLVTFKVLFQCKRYGDRNAVTPSQVRDFRGAMQGRADKGLILTTGIFTSDARREATRDGVPPIELVDGDKLVAMFERARMGLRPVQTFEVEDAFFEEFRK